MTLDMDALTAPQQRVLSAIACGQDGGHHPAVLEALAAKGLIVGYEQTLPGAMPVIVTRWEVPVSVHMQWAAWCAAQPDDDEETP